MLKRVLNKKFEQKFCSNFCYSAVVDYLKSLAESEANKIIIIKVFTLIIIATVSLSACSRQANLPDEIISQSNNSIISEKFEYNPQKQLVCYTKFKNNVQYKDLKINYKGKKPSEITEYYYEINKTITMNVLYVGEAVFITDKNNTINYKFIINKQGKPIELQIVTDKDTLKESNKYNANGISLSHSYLSQYKFLQNKEHIYYDESHLGFLNECTTPSWVFYVFINSEYLLINDGIKLSYHPTYSSLNGQKSYTYEYGKQGYITKVIIVSTGTEHCETKTINYNKKADN